MGGGGGLFGRGRGGGGVGSLCGFGCLGGFGGVRGLGLGFGFAQNWLGEFLQVLYKSLATKQTTKLGERSEVKGKGGEKVEEKGGLATIIAIYPKANSQ